MGVVGIIPAAGYATRLPGLLGSKEMIRIDGRPVMDYLVERMHLADPDRIRIVTRSAKADVIEHAQSLGLELILGETNSTNQSIALGVADLSIDDVVLLGFPDSVWEPPEGFTILLSSLSASTEGVLGLFTTSEPERADVVMCDQSGAIREILVKPLRPPSDTIWGCAVVRRRALTEIASSDQPGEHFGALSGKGLIKGVRLSDRYLDVGTAEILSRLANDPSIWGPDI